MDVDQYIVQLILDGKHEEAAQLAHQVTERFRLVEDPTRGPIPEDTGACHLCGFVFGEHDCQHEVCKTGVLRTPPPYPKIVPPQTEKGVRNPVFYSMFV